MSLKPRNIDFHETWQGLKETVAGVVRLQAVERAAWNNRFSDVYSLCVAFPEPLADRLYDETKTFLEAHVETLLQQVIGSEEEKDDPQDGLLKRYHEAWTEYSQGIAYLNNLYLYLNLHHIRKQKASEAEIVYGSAATCDNPETAGKLEVGELGLWIWERGLVRPLAGRLSARCVAGLGEARDTALVDTERRQDRHVLKDTIASFVEAGRWRHPLALYTELVEQPMLEAAAEYHRRRAADLLQSDDLTDYVRQVLQGLDTEMWLAKQYMHESSVEAVRRCHETHTVAAHLPALHAECARLVKEERREDLSNLYRLLRPLQGALRPLVQTAHDHIQAEGTSALASVEGSENPHVQFVETMLTIYNKYKSLFQEVFYGDQAFMGALDKACSAVINARAPDQPCRSPELLARYCDSLLRKRGAGAATVDTETEDRLAAAIVVFKYVDDKDVFQKFYARALAKRLIHQLSLSMDHEEAMINRLKQACGYEFTNKLHRMFTDIAVSADLNAKFQQHLRDQGTDLGMGLSIQILQAGAWPLGGACSPLSAPPQLERPAQLFEQFYRAHFSGRRLAWLHHLCAGELRTRYTKRAYHVAAATPQCALLLAFETQDTIPASELRASLQLPAEAFVRHARGLLDAGLLTITGDLEGDESSCTLNLNLEFSSRRTRVRVALAGGGGVGGGATRADEADAAAASVDEDRKMYLQAAIVRIMKARKVLRHNELIQEVVSQARASFAPSVAMIKKCVEALIDKQYLERSPGQSDQYSYVA